MEIWANAENPTLVRLWRCLVVSSPLQMRFVSLVNEPFEVLTPKYFLCSKKRKNKLFVQLMTKVLAVEVASQCVLMTI